MFTLSEEAVAAIVLCFQKSLMEEQDLLELLSGLEFRPSDEMRLFVMNPPLLKLKNEEEEEDTSFLFTEGSD